MYIEKLELNNFRNYKKLDLKLEQNINIFYGDNAQGKTNILEAIFLCAFGKSFRTNKEKELINLDENFFDISLIYKKSDRDGKIQINFSDKKNIKVNGVKIIQGGSLPGSGDDYTISKRLCGNPSQTCFIMNNRGIEAHYPVELGQ